MRIPKLVGQGGLRDILIAVTIVALVALSWSLVAGGGSNEPGPLLKHYLYILAYSYIILVLPPVSSGRRLASAISIVAGLGLAVFLAADLTTMRFFDSPFLELYRYLPVTAGNASMAALAGYAASYVPVAVWLLATAAVFVGMGLSRCLRDRGRARLTILALLPLFYAAASLATASSGPSDPRIAALIDEPRAPLRHFGRSDRSGHFTLAAAPRAQPRTIIFVIMESTGASTPASDGKRLLSQSIAEESGADRWIDFENAVTNSNATDISVPSLLTGSGAHEPIAKIEALPFVSQYAAARGYRTAFITSSTMQWAGFDAFFDDAQMDEIITAENSRLPFVNDLAVDDHFVYRTAAEAIEKADGKLFLTLYPQALHWPFQTDSTFGVPSHIKDRRGRAAYIAERGFRLLFDSLRKAGRLDDTLIIIAGDHGEFDYASTLKMPRMRMDTFDEGILSPIFLIKAPASLSARDFGTLTGNSGKLVANLDIAPTLADLLGGQLKEGLAYNGHSLLREIPDTRVTYSTSTNEWRHWTKAAIAVARGRDRMTCDKADLCRLSTAAGSKLTAGRAATPDDEFFRLALSNPVLRQALGQVYRDYYQ